MALVVLLIFVVVILILLIVIRGGHNPRSTTEEKPADDVIAADASLLNETKEPTEEVGSEFVRNKAKSLSVTDLEGLIEELLEEVARLKEAEARRAQSATVNVPATPSQQDQAAGKVGAPVRTEFVYDKARPLDGIIADLTRGCCGNVHKKGVVKVTAGSCLRGDPENAVNLESDYSYFIGRTSNLWICYDFKGRRVTPTSYSIRSYSCGSGWNHPKSWVLEVSNDGSEGSWEVVDSRKDNNDLNDKLVTRNFSLGTPQSGSFRFVRLHLTGKNHGGDDDLIICSLELFGALIDMTRPVAAPGAFPFWELKHLDGIIAHCDARVRRKRSREGGRKGHSEWLL